MEPKILKRLDGYPPHEPAAPRVPAGMQAMSGEVQGPDEPWTAHTYAAELLSRGEDPHVRVECGCGRTRPAFAVIDARALPPEVRGSAEWACDACVWEWQVRHPGQIGTPMALAVHLGAPGQAIAALQAATEMRDAST